MTRNKPRLLDLFCGAGGATRGYQEVGFYVVGMDIHSQSNYCGDEFHQADALTYPLEDFDAYHASPPCQAYSRGGNPASRTKYPRLIEPIRERLLETGKPYVIENVVGAPLLTPNTLCGEMFGLSVIRHRLFESNVLIPQPEHIKHRGTASDGYYFGVYNGGRCGCFGNNEKRRKLRVGTTEEWQGAMGIDWMTRYELTQAIPPAYTEYIGLFLMKAIECAT